MVRQAHHERAIRHSRENGNPGEGRGVGSRLHGSDGCHACAVCPAATTAPRCHSEPFGYAQGKLREESRASDHTALGSTRRAAAMHRLGFFVAALLRMTDAAGLSSCPCKLVPYHDTGRASRGGADARSPASLSSPYLLRSAARNSACVFVPFTELHALHNSCRLSTWSVPPLALGTT